MQASQADVQEQFSAAVGLVCSASSKTHSAWTALEQELARSIAQAQQVQPAAAQAGHDPAGGPCGADRAGGCKQVLQRDWGALAELLQDTQ